MQQFK